MGLECSVPCAGQRLATGVAKNCCPALETDLSISIVERPANGDIVSKMETCCPFSRMVNLGFPGRGESGTPCRGNWGHGKFPLFARNLRVQPFSYRGVFACDVVSMSK